MRLKLHITSLRHSHVCSFPNCWSVWREAEGAAALAPRAALASGLGRTRRLAQGVVVCQIRASARAFRQMGTYQMAAGEQALVKWCRRRAPPLGRGVCACSTAFFFASLKNNKESRRGRRTSLQIHPSGAALDRGLHEQHMQPPHDGRRPGPVERLANLRCACRPRTTLRDRCASVMMADLFVNSMASMMILSFMPPGARVTNASPDFSITQVNGHQGMYLYRPLLISASILKCSIRQAGASGSVLIHAGCLSRRGMPL